MTTVTFLTEGKRIIGFDAKGHSGYAEAGSDIVCAAITSAVRLVDATVNDVLGLAASVKVHERSGSIEFRLPGGLPVSSGRLDALFHGAARRIPRKHRSNGGVSLLSPPRIILQKGWTTNYDEHWSSVLRS